MHHINILELMHTGTMMQSMAFTCPSAALFFHHSPNKLIVACRDNIFTVDVSAHSTQPFSATPQDAYYYSHALAFIDDDSVLVAGNSNSTYSVCGYDTASGMQLWIYETVNEVGAVCMLGAHVLVTVACSPTLVLDPNTGSIIAELQKADGDIFGVGFVEGSRVIHSFLTSH
jgi:hypothetical protein